MKNENNLKLAQVFEATARMIMLGVDVRAIASFIESRKIYKADEYGNLYWLDDEEKNFIKTLEEENNALVYYILESNEFYGRVLNIFFVSSEKDEWENDREIINKNRSFCYVKNLNIEEYSEFGHIYFQKDLLGNIHRVA